MNETEKRIRKMAEALGADPDATVSLLAGAVGQTPLPDELVPPHDAAGVDAIRDDSGLSGAGLREQFLLEARRDPAAAGWLLGAASVKLLGEGADIVAAVEAMTDEEFESFAAPQALPADPMTREAVSKSFQDLNRAREAIILDMDLRTVPAVRDAGIPEGSPILESLEEYDVVTRPRDGAAADPTRSGARSLTDRFIGLGQYALLPPDMKRTVGAFLGQHFVDAAEATYGGADSIEDDDEVD